MTFIGEYDSPLGNIILAADEIGLTGLWFEGQKYIPNQICSKAIKNQEVMESEPEIFKQTKRWLDEYFLGKDPKFMPPLHLVGTLFRQEIWQILLEIPYGKTVTYGEIAYRYCKRKNKKAMSAQAIGGAVGHNPIAIIVPCHRVVGADGSLTGYAGGLERKQKLLDLEGA